MRSSKLLNTIFGLTLFAQLMYEVSTADSTSYMGAVVEYYPVKNGTNGTTIAIANAKNYVTIIRKARSYNADIVIFPETSLTEGLTELSETNRSSYPEFSSFIPEPGTDQSCDNSSTVVIEALRLISCAAKNNSIYVLVNLNEKVNCTKRGTTSRPCPKDGYFFYNTNVVFDRKGGILSKYRKFNLFGEIGFNVTSTPDIATFTTDFNVTFGHIVCFDIYFDSPSLTLIKEYKVTDILHPLRWFAELPYLTAVQTQSGWSYANNVNLLSSGYNMPATGSGGSGIYAGTRGNLVTLMPEKPKNALLVARVPKVINGVRKRFASGADYPRIHEFTDTEITTLIDVKTVAQQAFFQGNLLPYTTRLLTPTNGTTTTSQKLCNRGLCCSFYVNRTFFEESVIPGVSHYRYRMAVFNGVRLFFGGSTGGEQICSLISCTDDTLASCGLRFSARDNVVQPTVFNKIRIFGNFSTGSDTTQIPNSLTANLLPLNTSDFTFRRCDFAHDSVRGIEYKSVKSIENLLTFAIYGRNFSADGLPATE